MKSATIHGPPASDTDRYTQIDTKSETVATAMLTAIDALATGAA